MSRKEEKWIKRLEILGASAAVIVIVSAVGTFLLDSIAMQLMALAVGCGSIVNVVLMVLCYYKKKTVPSIILRVRSTEQFVWHFSVTVEIQSSFKQR